jgi:predicted DNA-binding transcriptional regulator YafY
MSFGRGLFIMNKNEMGQYRSNALTRGAANEQNRPFISHRAGAAKQRNGKGTSVRTIYRDCQALSETGVPIIGAPGTGYSLMKGYFLPPISFTVEEAVALLIGTDFIEQRFDDEYRVRAQAARRKIEAILSEGVRNETSRVRKALRLITHGKRVALSKEREYFKKIRRAILDERKIRFHFEKAWRFQGESP